MLRRVGLVRYREPVPAGFGLALSAERAASFATAAWLTLEEVRRMTLASLPGVIPDSVARPGTREFAIDVGQRAWAYLPDTHFCPDCLRERAGAWRLSWKVPWSFLCHRHRTFLVPACHRCGARPGGGRADSGTRPRLLREVPLPAHCKAKLLQDNCLADFRPMRPVPIGEAPRLADAQRVISTVLADGHGEFGGHSLGAADWFGEMRSLVALVMHTAEADDILIEAPAIVHEQFVEFLAARNAGRIAGPGGPRNRFFMRTPRSPYLMAAVVPWAVFVAESQSPTELRIRLSPILRRLADRTGRYAAPLVIDKFALAPRIGAAATAHLYSLTPGDRWLATVRRSAPLPARVYFGPHHIPRLIWLDEWRGSFEPLLRTKFRESARAFCSVALSRRVWGGTWGEAAKRIGIRSDIIDARRCVDRLARSEQLALFVRLLDETCQRLGRSIPLVDYRWRERRFAAMESIDGATWRARTGGGRDTADRRYGSAWVWSELTGLDGADAPFLRATPQERETYRRFVRERLGLFLPQLCRMRDGIAAATAIAVSHRQDRSANDRIRTV
jgi:hypothetical protein